MVTGRSSKKDNEQPTEEELMHDIDDRLQQSLIAMPKYQFKTAKKIKNQQEQKAKKTREIRQVKLANSRKRFTEAT